MKIDGHTKLYGVIGDPIGHTLSPYIHNALFERTGLNGVYVPIHVTKENLQKAIAGFYVQGFRGINVTIPHKKAVFDLVTEASAEAKLAGAVNTLSFSEKGVFGTTTDGEGFIRSLAHEGFLVKDKAVLLYGAGGAAQSLAVRLLKEGVTRLVILNRTLQKAVEIRDLLRRHFLVDAEADTPENAEKYLPGTDLLIHSTPVGMAPNTDDAVPIPWEALKPGAVVTDLIYNPHETLLLKEARKHGHQAINGWGMLYYQAVCAFELWTNTKIDFYIKSPFEKE